MCGTSGHQHCSPRITEGFKHGKGFLGPAATPLVGRGSKTTIPATAATGAVGHACLMVVAVPVVVVGRSQPAFPHLAATKHRLHGYVSQGPASRWSRTCGKPVSFSAHPFFVAFSHEKAELPLLLAPEVHLLSEPPW